MLFTLHYPLFTGGEAAPAQTVPVYRVDKVAGTGEYVSGDQIGSNDGGPAIDAHLSPEDLAMDAAGNIFLADWYRIRRIDAATGIITTVAISDDDIISITVDGFGNILFSAAYKYIRRIDAVTGIISIVAGNGSRGYGGDGGAATNAAINAEGIVVDSAGNIFIADTGNKRIRRIDAATGIITTVAGGGEDTTDGGLATGAALDYPRAIAMDGSGNILFAEKDRIRKIDVATGIISAVAEGLAQRAAGGSIGINRHGMALDRDGNIFVAIWLRVLRVDAATGIVSHIAGNGDYRLNAISSGDGGLALNAGVFSLGMAVDDIGNVFFVGDRTIRRLTPWTGGDPTIAAGGVVQASGTPVVKHISPNAIISVFGQDFTALDEPTLGGALDASGRVPVNLADTCLEIGKYAERHPNVGIIKIDGKLVPLFMVSPRQINAQAPHDLTPGEDVLLTVISGCGTADALRSPEVSARVSALTPAFFNVVNNPDGRNPLVAQHGGGPALAGPPELGAAFTPAAPGEVVTLYGTGFGPTEPALEAGVVPGARADLAYQVSFNVGGIAVPPGDILYAGAAPCCAGLYQFALRLPANLPDGDAPVTANVLGVFTPPGPFLTVQRQ